MNVYKVYLDTLNQDQHEVQADGHSISEDQILSFFVVIKHEENEQVRYTSTEWVAVFKNWAWFQKTS